MSNPPYTLVIKELESYLNQIQGKKIKKKMVIQLCAINHVHLMPVLERHRLAKRITYYIRYIAKCEPSESSTIIKHFRKNGYAVNEYSKSGQPEIVVLF